LESDEEVGWVKNNEVVIVIGIVTESNVKFVHVMTSQQQRGYIRQVHVKPYSEGRASRSRA
jgi:hypothetical protein